MSWIVRLPGPGLGDVRPSAELRCGASLLEWLFRIGMERVEMDVVASDVAGTVFPGTYMTEEGWLVGELLNPDGSREDVRCFAMLRQEWPAARNLMKRDPSW